MNDENNSKLSEGEGFSSVDLIYQCLIDVDKFNAFNLVLKKNVTNTSKVLDIGTGSGILALTAARLGAESVIAVEFDPTVSKIANNNFKQNNFSEKIKCIVGDARFFDLSKYKFDLIVMELLATGLVDEMQVEVINNLCDQGIISNTTKVVPFAQENYLSLADTNFNLYGFNMKMIKHLWSHDHNEKSFSLLSEDVLINKVEFNKKNDRNFSQIIKFKANISGKVNSICLTSKILVDESGEIVLNSTHSLNPIVFIPMDEKKVEIGDLVSIKVDYLMGGGFINFNVNYI